jgi:hypothetical protein
VCVCVCVRVCVCVCVFVICTMFQRLGVVGVSSASASLFSHLPSLCIRHLHSLHTSCESSSILFHLPVVVGESSASTSHSPCAPYASLSCLHPPPNSPLSLRTCAFVEAVSILFHVRVYVSSASSSHSLTVRALCNRVPCCGRPLLNSL